MLPFLRTAKDPPFLFPRQLEFVHVFQALGKQIKMSLAFMLPIVFAVWLEFFFLNIIFHVDITRFSIFSILASGVG